MTLDQLITVVLASTVVSAIITTIFSFVRRRQDYRLEFYKSIIEKRIKSYEFLENQIALMKMVVIDETDGKTYHSMFRDEESSFKLLYGNLTIAMGMSIWINEKTCRKMEEMNGLFYNILLEMGAYPNKTVEIGKHYYNRIAESRIQLENLICKDVVQLHNIRRWRKDKKPLKVATRKLYVETNIPER